MIDGLYRSVMLCCGHDIAAERAQAAQARAKKADKKVDDEKARLAAAERDRQHAEQLDATLAFLEAIREAGLAPTPEMPEVVRIRDPEAAARGMRERAARAAASREQFRLLFPARRERQAIEEMIVRSGGPTIVDPEASPNEVVGYGR